MRKIYIAHPLRGAERAKNVEEVTKICKKITELFPDVLPISPIHAFSFLDDCGAEGEKKALELCLEMVKTCDEAWFFGNWHESEGCSIEFDTAHVRRIYGPQDCEQILAAYPAVESNKSELVRWLLEEVYEPYLKPCPFCGGAAVIFEDDDDTGSIGCNNLDCPAECAVNWDVYESVNTRAEAIAAWNRRAGE